MDKQVIGRQSDKVAVFFEQGMNPMPLSHCFRYWRPLL